MNAPIVPLDDPTPSSSNIPSAKRRRTKEHQKEAVIAEESAPATRAAIDFKQVLFIECFAGGAVLTKAVARLGFHTDVPQDVAEGGANFENDEEVVNLWRRWAEFRAAGFQLVFHMAPPCCSFSAVRDRSRRTRLISSSKPEGLDTYHPLTSSGNAIAKNTALSIKYLVRELDAVGSLEQPARSYMLPFLDNENLLEEHEEIVLDQCRYGRPYKKPTVFLAFGGLPIASLANVCRNMDCGRQFHVRLGFGSASTAAAAEYSQSLAAAYAGALAKHFDTGPDPETAIERLTISKEGVLKRHVDRGSTLVSARSRRAAEDEASRAGWKYEEDDTK